MKNVWLRVREATVRKMLTSGELFTPDQILSASTSLLVGEGGIVESDLYYEAIKYAVERKFSGMSDVEILLMTGRKGKGKSVDVALASLEIARRREG